MFDRVAKSIAKVKLSGGLVGRVCTVSIWVVAAIACMAIASMNPYVLAGGIAVIFLLFGMLLWKVTSFADKHPNVAILDGAQFVRAEEMRHAVKGAPIIIADDQKVTVGTRGGKVLQIVDQVDPPEEPA